MANSQQKFYGVLIAVALAGAALIGYVVTREDPGALNGSTPATGLSTNPAPGGELVPMDVGVAKGSEDAPVVIEEYADFQCPYCGMVAQLVVPTLVERYVETGKVRYVFFDFPVHAGEKSYWAAEAARCAGDQNAFWAMHDVLFQRMAEWSPKRDPRGQFEDYAETLGLDEDALRDCIDSNKYRDVVLASRARGEQHAVNSTPTFFINGRRVEGATGFDALAEIVEEELAESS